MRSPRRPLVLTGAAMVAALVAATLWLRTPAPPVAPQGWPAFTDAARWEPASRAELKKARADYFHMILRDPATDRVPADIRARELAFARTLPRTAPGKREAFVWAEAGPNDVGGRTRALALDVRDPDVVIAGGASGGIWKSTDGGESWVSKSDPADQLDVTSVAQDPRPGFQDTWYYTSGEYYGSADAMNRSASFYGSGVYRSDDGGESWTAIQTAGSRVRNDTEFDYVSKVVVSPASGSVFLASNNHGILRSDDQGVTFTLVLGDRNDHEWSDVVVSADGRLAAVVSGGTDAPARAPGVYRSDDDGLTWTRLDVPGFPESPLRSVLALAPSNPDVAYLASQTDPPAFYRLDLAAGAVEDRSANLPDFEGEETVDFQQGYNMVVAVKPDDEDFVLLGATNLYRSRDGFATKPTDIRDAWIGGYNSDTLGSFLYPGQHPDQHVIVFDPTDPDRMWAGHDGGLSRIDDVTTTEKTVPWTSRNNGYNVTQFYTVALGPASGDRRLVGGTQDNGSPSFQFDGMRATASADASGGDGSHLYLGRSYAYVSSQNGAVLRRAYAADGSLPRSYETPTSVVTPESLAQALFINPFAVDPNDEDVMFLPGVDVLWRNDALSSIPDNEAGTMQGWTRLAGIEVPEMHLISALEVSTSDPAHVLYVGVTSQTGTPAVLRLDEAHTATEGAVRTELGEAEDGSYIHDIAVHPLEGDELLVVLSNYNVPSLFHSTDGGHTFTDVEGNLAGTGGDGPSFRAAAILPRGGGSLYVVGTSTGVYSTSSLAGAATVWEQEGADVLGNVVVNALAARIADATIAAGTHGRGIFVGTGPTVNLAPTARFSNEPTAADPLTIRFDASASSDPNGDALTYAWTFGDGATGSGPAVSHRYAAPGRYTVRLAVTDPAGLSSETGREVDVSETYTFALRSYDAGADVLTVEMDRVAPIDTGFVSGPNVSGGRAIATALALPDADASGVLKEVRLLWGYRRDGLASGTYTLEVYDGTVAQGPTGSPLYSRTHALQDVDADADPDTPEAPMTYAIDPPVPVGGSFFVAVDFGTYGRDAWGSAAVATTEFFERRIPEVWWRTAEGQWRSFVQDLAPGMDFGWQLIVDASVQVGAGPATAVEPDETPETFTLAQNYPNPFNPATTIAYTLPQAAAVTLTVYDVLGRRVATLVDGIQPGGDHRVHFDATGMPSGVYVYRLQAGRDVREHTMLLVK